jgi:hypothetical protein
MEVCGCQVIFDNHFFGGGRIPLGGTALPPTSSPSGTPPKTPVANQIRLFCDFVGLHRPGVTF